MNRKIFLAAILALISQFTFAQLKPVAIGQRLPSVQLTNLFNTELKSINLNEYRGKIILIDFWTTYCHGCIAGLEQLDALQKKYKDQIFILPVSPQKKEVVAKFWRSNHITKKSRLLTLTDDKILHELFPHSGTPAEFWIDADGNFLGPTSIEYVNEIEINKLLQKKSLDWVHKGLVTPYDFSKPMLVGSKKNDTSAFFYSTFSGFKPDKKAAFNIMVDSINKSVRITFVNYNIQALYNATLTEGLARFQKLWRLDINDSTRLKYNKSFGYRSKWDVKNSFCYELSWPLNEPYNLENIYAKMRSDFDQYFGFKSYIASKNSSYVLLTGRPSGLYPKVENSVPLSDMLNIWNQSAGLPIIKNEASQTNQVFVDFAVADIKDVEMLKSALLRLGYQISLVQGELPYFNLEDTRASL